MTATTSNAQPAAPEGQGQERLAEWQLARLIAGWVRPLWRPFALFLGLTAGRAVCLSAVVYTLNLVLSSLLPAVGEPRFTAFAVWAAAFLVCQVLAAGCQYLGEEMQRRFLVGLELSAFQWAMRHLILLPADYFRSHPLVKFVFYVEKFQQAIRVSLTASANILMRAVSVAGIVAGVLPQAPLYAGPGIVLLLGLSFWIWRRGTRLRALAKQEIEIDVGFIDRVLAIFSNVGDLQNYGLRESALRQFDECCKTLTARSLQIVKVQAAAGVWVVGAGVLLLAGLLVAAVALGLGLANALTCFSALLMLLDPFSEIIRTRMSMQARLVKLGELYELIRQVESQQQQSGRRPPAGPIEELRFENVGYAIGGTTILEGVSFTARRGEVIGIIGRSGAGKTTLAHLALRLMDPTAGRILVNGEDAAQTDLAAFWEQSAYIAQVPYRVGATLAEEVALVAPAAGEAALAEALRLADIDDGLSRRPLDSDDWHSDGRQTPWHTRSLQQRTEWARLWLRPSRLAVLDEPTSLADAEQERRFVQNLLHRREGRITLVISHRPATLAACDRVLVVQAGRLVAEGTRQDIFARWLPALEQEGGVAG